MDIVVVSTLGLLKTKCWGGDQDGGVQEHGAHLPQNISKIHLQVERVSQKTSWKLAEDLHNQSCKKDLQVKG